MLCMGDDDRQYRDENGVKVQHGQMPVKGALHRLRGRPLTAIRLCCKGKQAEISSRVQISATKQSK